MAVQDGMEAKFEKENGLEVEGGEADRFVESGFGDTEAVSRSGVGGAEGESGPQASEFGKLGLSAESLAAVSKKGFEVPSPIQRLAIPRLLSDGCDLIGQAQTGTGKTAAFGLPLLEAVSSQAASVEGLILAPTRELALQVTDELGSLSGDRRHGIVCVYGGQSIAEQQRRLRRGPQLVVGTPGRILDLISRGDLKLGEVRWFILDEADEMLNMGFIEDVEQILEHVPEERRTILFSATMPSRIVSLAKRFMRDPERVMVDAEQKPTGLADQIYFEVREGDKFDALTRIVDIEPEFYGLVFCRTRNDVDELVLQLVGRGYSAEALHGDIGQAQREKTLTKFRNRYINILVATDVAARGIDIADLSHVINYSLPNDPAMYVHRVGRTGRAGKSGTAITFVTPSEYRRLLYFQKSIRFKIRKESLPTAEDIVEVKRALLLEQLGVVMESGGYESFLPVAQELLSVADPAVVIAALFRMAYGKELDVNSYQEIRSFRVDSKGTTRLFVALGRRDGYNARSLVEYISREGEVPGREIDDVAVMDEYSFLTVSYETGKRLLSRFADEMVRGKPLLSKARTKRR